VGSPFSSVRSPDRSSVLGSEWTTTSTITLTITQYRLELREHRHLCRSYTTHFTRHDIVMRLDRQYPGEDAGPRRNRRLGATAGSEYLGFPSGRVEVSGGHPGR
jgi:hypothetical protein